MIKRLLLVSLLASPAFAVNDNRYVATTGNDASNNCLSAGTPCRTIQVAVNLAACGDTVIVADGAYAGFTSTRVCTSGTRLTIKAANTWGATLDSSTPGGGGGSNGLIYMNNASYVDVNGFSMTRHVGGAAAYGMRIVGGTGVRMINVKDLADCVVPNTIGDSTYVTGSTGTVMDGVNVGQVYTAAADCNFWSSFACFSSDQTTGYTIQNTTCHDVRNWGQLNNSFSPVVQDNTIINMWNHGIGLVDNTGGLVQRNTFYTTVANASAGPDAIWIVCAHDANVRNNTIAGALSFPVTGITVHPNCANSANSDTVGPRWTNTDNLTISNNLSIDETNAGDGYPLYFYPTMLAAGTPVHSDYNLFNGNNGVAWWDGGGIGKLNTLGAWQSASISQAPSRDANSTSGLPLFVDKANHDYRPAAGGAQINAGDNSNCANTIVGGQCDIGAVEYTGSTADTTAPSPIANVTPANAATGLSLTPTLVASTATDTTGPVEYTFELFQAANCSGSTTQTRGYTTASSWPITSALAAGTQYAWRYRARDSVGTPNVSSFSTCTTFTTLAATTDIACTNAAFEAAIAEINAGTRTLITWQDSCANTTIQITGDTYPGTTHAVARTLASNRPNVVIDGEDKHIRFDMNPPWWDNDTTLCGTCVAQVGTNCDPGNTGAPTLCPVCHDGGTDQWFVRLLGAGQKVKNLEYRYFMEGVRLEADGTEVDGVVGILPGDEDVSNVGGANAIIRNSTFSAACDKNIQAYGNEVAGAANYDLQIYNTVVTNSSSGIRVSLNGGPARIYIEDSFFTEDAPTSSLFNSNGPYFGDVGSGDAIVVYMKDSVVDSTRRGIRVTGATQFISLGGNTFQNNTRRGISCEGNSKCLLQNDTFVNNGGTGAATADQIPGYGAIAVGNTCVGGTGTCGSAPYAANCYCVVDGDCQSGNCSDAGLDAGGGTQTLDGATMHSAGGNVFSGNSSNALGDSTLAIHNLTPGSVKAEGNCFGTSVMSIAGTYVTGAADIDPLGTCGLAPVGTLRVTTKASVH